MKRKRFSVEQIVAVLKQAELGGTGGGADGRGGSLSRRSTAGRSGTRARVSPLRTRDVGQFEARVCSTPDADEQHVETVNRA